MTDAAGNQIELATPTTGHAVVSTTKTVQALTKNKLDKLTECLEEVPSVRADAGYPPLVTPSSQIVGTQAVMNVVLGERYKMVGKESKGLLKGEYGQVPGEVNEEVRKKAIGDEEVITCRPADLLEPELEKYRQEAGDLARCEEDVLSYALFPQVAAKFLEERNKPAADENAVRELYVEDLGQ